MWANLVRQVALVRSRAAARRSAAAMRQHTVLSIQLSRSFSHLRCRCTRSSIHLYRGDRHCIAGTVADAGAKRRLGSTLSAHFRNTPQPKSAFHMLSRICANAPIAYRQFRTQAAPSRCAPGLPAPDEPHHRRVSPWARHDRGTQPGIFGCEHPVKADQMQARTRHQRCERLHEFRRRHTDVHRIRRDDRLWPATARFA